MSPGARPLLEQLEAGADADALLAALAFLAGRELELDPAEQGAAGRRALLLLAAGGDPHRGLDPEGRAVRSLAGDLDRPERRRRLTGALGALRGEAGGLARVGAALDALLADDALAWRWFAVSTLADELSPDDVAPAPPFG